MINLFEYQNKCELNPSLDGLESFLDDIWNSRDKSSYYYENRDVLIEW